MMIIQRRKKVDNRQTQENNRFPEQLTDGNQPRENRWDRCLRWVAYGIVILAGIYLWQKVLLGVL